VAASTWVFQERFLEMLSLRPRYTPTQESSYNVP
jgi:hypothetical protein